MLLKDILLEKSFHMGISATEKKDIILEISKFFETKYQLDHKIINDALWNREQKGSTGLGAGLAIPHARIPNIGSMKLAVFYSKEGKDFASYDQGSTYLFFAAIIDADAQPQEQLEMLKTIVEACETTDLMSALKEAHTSSQLRDIIIRRIAEIQNH